MNILETRDLHHDFSGLNVLFGVNLEVAQGERHVVIGPNGAGKTTLFNTITGTYRPSSGKVFFNGKDITGKAPYQLSRMKIGRSFQITSTLENMTTFQNLRLAVMAKHGIRYNLLRYVDRMKKITRETDQLLERVGLSNERDVLACNLSYGKSRALDITMAFGTDPDLVLLDEFTAGMSKEETKTAVNLVMELTEGKTTVIIEHDMDVVFSIADRITVLHYGKILATGLPEDIRENQDVKDAYLGDLHVA
jgi:branched-chain amino acid transport system ATP-binding protein